MLLNQSNRRYQLKQFASIFFLLFFGLAGTMEAQLPIGFARQRLATGLDPTDMKVAPDGRVFLVEKFGQIKIFRNGSILPDPFLEIDVDNFNERGLGGLVLHPNFDQNNWFYVFYTVPNSNYNRISRFTAAGDFALPTSEEIIFELDLLRGTIHNGGAMVFGKDGKLYVGVGEGADPNVSNDLTVLGGKILRINEDGSIPEDNPFYNELEDKNKAIWAYGFRNPFNMVVDQLTGNIYATDVGSQFFEEINQIEAGKYYGWPQVEGPSPDPNITENYVDPFFHYAHADGCAVVGLGIYQPEIFTFPPAYHNKLFYGEYCFDYMNVLDPQTAEITETFTSDIFQVVQIQSAPNGDMYYLQRSNIGDGSVADNTQSASGELWRIWFDGSGAPFISIQPSAELVVAGEPILLSVQANGNDPLRFQWYANDELIPGANQPTYLIPSSKISDNGTNMYCWVTNDIDSVKSESVELAVTDNQRPSVTLEQIHPFDQYQGGQTIAYQAIAVDPENGDLEEDHMTWWIDFHHDDHTHPALGPIEGSSEVSFTVPSTGETATNVWYRVYCQAIDDIGLTSTEFAEVFPQLGSTTLESNLPSIQLVVDGMRVNPPHELAGVVGIQRFIAAPLFSVGDSEIHFFNHWEGIDVEENAFVHFVSVDPDRFVAIYESSPLGNGIGLEGEYFLNTDLQDPVIATRLDPTIDFNLGVNDLNTALGVYDDYGVRWSGYIQPYIAGNFSFEILTDDGCRVWIDSIQQLDAWRNQPTTRYLFDYEFTDDNPKPITIEYYEAGGQAVISLSWMSQFLGTQVVPKTQLFPPNFRFYDKDFELLVQQVLSGQLDLLIGSNENSNVTFDLFDQRGRLVHSEDRTLVVGKNPVTLQTEHLPSAAYFMRIYDDQVQTTHKIMIVY